MKNATYRYILFSYGRSKECYQEIFISKQSQTLEYFLEMFRSCVVDTVKELLCKVDTDKGKDNPKKIVDFDIISSALGKFESFQSDFTKYQPDISLIYKIPADSNLFSKEISNNKTNLQNESNVLMQIWDGFNEDSIESFLFSAAITPMPDLNTALEKLIEELNESSKNETISDDALIQSIKKNGLIEIPLGQLFWGCKHSLSPYFEEILGAELFKRLKNETGDITLVRSEKPLRTSAIEDDAELPF
jgi:hypothetical protein